MSKILNILGQWNRWGGAKLDSGFTRDLTQKIIKTLEIEEVITLVGPRRAGKTTIMYQLIDHLEKYVDPKAILHVNFEEPALATRLNLDLLDKIYDEYRENIYPEGKAYIFLDEIQNIKEWERWVRSRNENQNIKIFITGSSAQLMSRELATLLTGRHLTFYVHPLNFKEFLQFKNISSTKEILTTKPPAQIKHSLLEYLKWGGFPRIVLEKDEAIKSNLLSRYFDDILFKDIVLRHQIRDAATLRNLAAHLLTQTASMISIKRIANIFNVSEDLIANYLNYLSEGFITGCLQFYSLKASFRNRKPRKNYAIDLGLRSIVSLSESHDIGRTIETAIYNSLIQKFPHDVFYYNENGEVDFLTREGIRVNNLYQVTYNNLDDPKIFNRETKSLLSSKEQFKDAKLTLIAWEIPNSLPNPEIAKKIDIIPFWKFLLENS